MHSQTTPRALVIAVTMLLLAALATPSCSLLPKSTPPAPKPAGVKKAVPASNTASPTVEPVEVQLVDTAGLKALGAEDATIVDIRTKADFDLEHLPEAVSVPMAKFTDTAEDWATDEPVVVYGSKDAKSQTAAAWLVRNGFERVYRLEGGIEAYEGQREGPLGKYRLDKPTVVYLYNDAIFPICKEVTPKVEELKKKYGKKVDFYLIDPANPSTFEQPEPVEDVEPLEGTPTPYITTLPTFFMIESDPRTYRKGNGADGLRVLYGWLQNL